MLLEIMLSLLREQEHPSTSMLLAINSAARAGGAENAAAKIYG